MIGNRRSLAAKLMAGALLGLVAACAAPPPPPAPPPPAPTPPRPVPPLGAQDNFVVPPKGPDGVRQTINVGLSPNQAVWNVRAAFNVAALDCLDPKYAEILPAYSSFLKAHKSELSRANAAVDSEYRAKYGRTGYIAPREAYMTQVYNYFALPPTMGPFCDASLQMARDSALIPKGGLGDFATTELARLEATFESFFTDYEAYRTALAAWNAKYNPQALVPATAPAPAYGYPAPGPALPPVAPYSGAPAATPVAPTTVAPYAPSATPGS